MKRIRNSTKFKQKIGIETIRALSTFVSFLFLANSKHTNTETGPIDFGQVADAWLKSVFTILNEQQTKTLKSEKVN